MTTFQAIRETEQNMQDARARGYLKQPVHRGQTYTEYKAEKRRRLVKIYHVVAMFTLFWIVMWLFYQLAVWMVG